MTVTDIQLERILTKPEKCMTAQSFEQIYEKFRDIVYNYLLYQTNDPERAADLYQDAMMKIFRKHRDQVDPARLRAWIYTVARNTFLDDQRRRRRMRRFVIWQNEEAAEAAVVEVGSGDLPDDLVEKKEIINRLNKKISELPADQREVIIMHYVWELPFREIAELLGISINTIAARARYGLQKIRLSIGDES
jgi:RNA polymerase sigma-70 factor (ECF subfamily)